MRLIGLVLRAIGVGLRFLRDVLFGVFSLVFLAGLALLGYQAFVWLRDGAWPALPLSLVLDAVPALSRWLREPQSWFGLHELLSGTLALAPLALVCLVLGFAGALLLECCEAPRQRLRSLWHFCNTPLVVFALFAVFLSSLVGTWQAQQAAREAYRETSRYTLESLHRLTTILENLPAPEREKIEASAWARAWEALRGEPAPGFWSGFAPLFPEFKAQRTERLLYYLTLRFPRQRPQLQRVSSAVRQLETLLTSEVRPGSALTAEQQQALAAVRQRLQGAVAILEGFLGN